MSSWQAGSCCYDALPPDGLPPLPQRRVSAWEVRPRALIVDPTAAIGEVLARWLRPHGFVVRSAAGLVDAVDLARNDPPHILIAYRSVRGGTYQQLHALLRQEVGLPRLATVYVTALYDPADIQRALLVGGGVYHQIPFDLDALYEQIRVLLAHTQGWLLPPSNADWHP